jgi:hypothetical protein
MPKKYIEITEEALARLNSGKFVPGSLHRRGKNGPIVFNAHKPRIRLKDKLIRFLEHGWVKESPARIKVYESIPKKLSAATIANILDRDAKVAKEAIIDREIINRV